eukprot:352544-Chlamydomonas_euryale.AAC.27
MLQPAFPALRPRHPPPDPSHALCALHSTLNTNAECAWTRTAARLAPSTHLGLDRLSPLPRGCSSAPRPCGARTRRKSAHRSDRPLRSSDALHPF